MTEFLYRAIDREGNPVSGITEAGSLEFARRNLLKSFRHILELGPREERRSSVRVKRQSLHLYTQQLSAMVTAAIPLTRALEVLCRGDDRRMNTVMAQVCRNTEAGSLLSVSMADYPGVFPRIYTSLVATGEATGTLHVVLEKLVSMLEWENALRRRLAAMFSYPITLAILAGGVSSLIVFYIFPILKPMFAQVGMELPAPTRALVTVSEILRSPWTWAAVALLAGLMTLLGRRLNREGSDLPGGPRYFLDMVVLEVPILGRLIDQSASSRILYSMAMMLEAGMNLREILPLLARTVGNSCQRQRLLMARKTLEEGCMLVDTFARYDVFRKGALHMLRAGEEAGKLAQMMRLVAKTYEEDLEVTLARMGAALEPIIMAILGVVIGFVCIASILPVLKFVQSI